ncbi:hypothetical protein LJB99_05490, partial [Deltaproteobacteria bacterium OttesenSCG-928-K17]|nr:hypothetical protein [Deltaproteobacteria bacterium OttesenSCG-928-K17]
NSLLTASASQWEASFGRPYRRAGKIIGSRFSDAASDYQPELSGEGAIKPLPGLRCLNHH